MYLLFYLNGIKINLLYLMLFAERIHLLNSAHSCAVSLPNYRDWNSSNISRCLMCATRIKRVSYRPHCIKRVDLSESIMSFNSQLSDILHRKMYTDVTRISWIKTRCGWNIEVRYPRRKCCRLCYLHGNQINPELLNVSGHTYCSHLPL